MLIFTFTTSLYSVNHFFADFPLQMRKVWPLTHFKLFLKWKAPYIFKNIMDFQACTTDVFRIFLSTVKASYIKPHRYTSKILDSHPNSLNRKLN